MSSSVGMALICACHRFGWPVARGGSRAITDALAAVAAPSTAGRSRPARRVRSLDELPRRRRGRPRPRSRRRRRDRRRPPARPGRARLPRATATGPARSRSTSRSRAACRGRTSPPARRHRARGRLVRGDRRRRARGQPRPDARAAVRAGRPAVPRRPEPLGGDVHPIWAYAHVPERLRRRRDRGAASTRSSASRPGCASGSSASSVRIAGRDRRLQRQLRRRRHHHRREHPDADRSSARASPSIPYATGIPGVYICSAATPPGAGAHGMNGYNAARSALRHIERTNS